MANQSHNANTPITTYLLGSRNPAFSGKCEDALFSFGERMLTARITVSRRDYRSTARREYCGDARGVLRLTATVLLQTQGKMIHYTAEAVHENRKGTVRKYRLAAAEGIVPVGTTRVLELIPRSELEFDESVTKRQRDRIGSPRFHQGKIIDTLIKYPHPYIKRYLDHNLNGGSCFRTYCPSIPLVSPCSNADGTVFQT